MRNMKKIGIIAIVVLSTAILSGCTSEYFGEPSIPASGIELELSELLALTSEIGIKEVNEILNASADLNAKIYGVNDVTGQQIMNEYDKEHITWTERFSAQEDAIGFTGNARSWSKTIYVHAIAVFDGALVKLLSDYDVIIITSHGYFTTYDLYFDWKP